MTGTSAEEWKSRGIPNSILLEKPLAPAQLLTAISQLLNTGPRRLTAEPSHRRSIQTGNPHERRGRSTSRARRRECRREAEKAKWEEVRREWLRLSEEFEKIADVVERRPPYR